MFEHFPYTNMHELNLDWIIEQVKKAYSPDNPPDNLVLSVNGQTGEVILYKDANIQLPSVESNQWNIYRLVASQNGQIARGIEFSGNGTARIINGTHRALIYTSENPPDYPVDSVNGQTGAVTIQVPFVNTTDELMQFATDSEDNYWGLRRNTTGGEAGIYLDTAGETVRAYITLMPEYEGEGAPQTFQLLTTNDIPESSGVVSVNGLTGVVRLYGTNIYRTDNSNQTINQALSTLENTTNTLNTRTTTLEGTANGLEDGIAIVANGNTHPAIASGQFVYVKNHESLAEGLYTANSAIATNATLTTSNLTADGSGGLNALKAKIGNVGNTDLQSQVSSLNSNFIYVYDSLTLNSDIEGTLRILRMGKLRCIYGNVRPSSSGSEIVLCTLATTDRPPIHLMTAYSGYEANATGEVTVYSDGRIAISANSAPANSLKFSITYVV